jgi:toxin YhaV
MSIVNGWHLFAHPLFIDQVEKLTAAVQKLQQKDPAGYQTTANAKLLAAIRQLVFETIPSDPTRADYRQGVTLGADRKHWFRVKFGNGRFRLFFRFDKKQKINIFTWVNDETTLRTYGAKTDAYAVFRKMLDGGNPPDTWVALLEASTSEAVTNRMTAAEPKT